MSATETLTSNPRVLGADPLVELVPESGTPGTPDHRPERPGGIGEEDMLTLVLPYIRSAREGVERLGALLAEHGTYEMNGIAFSDVADIWWLETVGGHHWIAKRIPEDHYVTMPNQLGIDSISTMRKERAGITSRARICGRSSRSMIWTSRCAPPRAPVSVRPRRAPAGASSTRARPSAPTRIPTTSTTRPAPGTCSAP